MVVTLAVFDICPVVEDLALTTMLTELPLPLGKLPRLQVTVPAANEQPGEAEMKVTWAGSGSPWSRVRRPVAASSGR